MRCRSLIAYLNNELGPFRRALMRIHIAACPNCRKVVDEEADLSREIRRLEDTPVPQNLRNKLLSDAMAASASAHMASSQSKPRLQGVLTMKRGLIALGLVAVIVAIGLGILPNQRGNIALADVARAMANVKSAHMTAWARVDGERHAVECWLEGRTKYVLIYDGKKVSADNGDISVEQTDVAGRPFITIKPSGSSPLWHGGNPLSLLQGDEEALDSWLKSSDAKITKWKTTTASNGVQQMIVEITSASGSKTLLTIDPNTRLVIGWSEQDNTGNIITAIEHIEYNVALDNSMFEMQIPEDAIVNDLTTVKIPDADVKARRAEVGQKLKASGAICWMGNLSSGGSIHVNLENGHIAFQSLDKDGVWVYQMPDSNQFHVLGKALVYTSDGDYKPDRRINEIVEDEDVIAPARVIPPSPPEPPASPTGIAKERLELNNKLIAQGAKPISSGTHGSLRGYYHRGLFFEPKDGGKQVYFLYFPDRNVYRVIGRAEMRYRALRGGFTKIVENREIKAPCKPDYTD